eukprot:gene18016-19818_t
MLRITVKKKIFTCLVIFIIMMITVYQYCENNPDKCVYQGNQMPHISVTVTHVNANRSKLSSHEKWIPTERENIAKIDLLTDTLKGLLEKDNRSEIAAGKNPEEKQLYRMERVDFDEVVREEEEREETKKMAGPVDNNDGINLALKERDENASINDSIETNEKKRSFRLPALTNVYPEQVVARHERVDKTILDPGSMTKEELNEYFNKTLNSTSVFMYRLVGFNNTMTNEDSEQSESGSGSESESESGGSVSVEVTSGESRPIEVQDKNELDGMDRAESKSVTPVHEDQDLEADSSGYLKFTKSFEGADGESYSNKSGDTSSGMDTRSEARKPEDVNYMEKRHGSSGNEYTSTVEMANEDSDIREMRGDDGGINKIGRAKERIASAERNVTNNNQNSDGTEKKSGSNNRSGNKDVSSAKATTREDDEVRNLEDFHEESGFGRRYPKEGEAIEVKRQTDDNGDEEIDDNTVTNDRNNSENSPSRGEGESGDSEISGDNEEGSMQTNDNSERLLSSSGNIEDSLSSNDYEERSVSPGGNGSLSSKNNDIDSSLPSDNASEKRSSGDIVRVASGNGETINQVSDKEGTIQNSFTSDVNNRETQEEKEGKQNDDNGNVSKNSDNNVDGNKSDQSNGITKDMPALKPSGINISITEADDALKQTSYGMKAKLKMHSEQQRGQRNDTRSLYPGDSSAGSASGNGSHDDDKRKSSKNVDVSVDFIKRRKSKGRRWKRRKSALKKSKFQGKLRRNGLIYFKNFTCNPISAKILLYNRIFKTGSTSLNFYIEETGKVNNFKVRIGSTEDWYKTGNSYPFPEEIERYSKKRSSKKYRFYSAHFFFRNNIDINKPHTYINQVRDPVDRIISHYHYMRKLKDRPKQRIKDMIKSGQINETLDECFAKQHRGCESNTMTHFFCGKAAYCRTGSARAIRTAKYNMLHFYAAIGLTDHMSEFLEILKLRLPRFFPASKRGLGYEKQNNDEKYRSGIAQWILDKIKAANKADYEIYEYAKELFQKQVKACKIKLLRKGKSEPHLNRLNSSVS